MKEFIKKIVLILCTFSLVASVPVLADGAAYACVRAPRTITLTPTKKSVKVGRTVRIRVSKVKPYKASKRVRWKSSNKRIATVSSKGLVKGLKAGTVKITATSRYNRKVKKTVTVRVYKPAAKPVTPSCEFNYVDADAVVENVSSRQFLVADIREESAFKRGHIVGATQVSSFLNPESADTDAEPAPYIDSSSKLILISQDTSEGSLANLDKTRTAFVEKFGLAPDYIYVLKGGMSQLENCQAALPYIARFSDINNRGINPVSGYFDYNYYNLVNSQQISDDLSGSGRYTLVDLRRPDDFSSGTIGNAISVPIARMDDAQSQAAVNTLVQSQNPNTTYVLICYSALKWAPKGTVYLTNAGVPIENICVLEKGYDGWKTFLQN